MECLKITKNAWHYKVACWGGFDEDLKSTDICRYTRRFILGVLLMTLISALVCLVSTPPVVYVAHFFYHRFPPFLVDLSTVVCCIYLAGITGFGIYLGIRKCIDLYKEAARQAKYKAIADGTYVAPEPKAKKPKPPKEPGMIMEMYKAYKRKYCVKIEIK